MNMLRTTANDFMYIQLQVQIFRFMLSASFGYSARHMKIVILPLKLLDYSNNGCQRIGTAKVIL